MKQLSESEVLAIAGLVMLGIGLALWYPPAALVVTGGLLLAYVMLPDRGAK